MSGALVRPSAAAIRLNCPGSIHLEKQVDIVEEDTEHSLLGREAHQWAAIALRRGEKALKKCSDREMAECVSRYNRFVRKLIAKVKPVDKVWVEQKVTYNSYMFGTADCVILYNGGTRILVPDYKHGVGHAVVAEENFQLIAYLLCTIAQLNLKRVEKATMIIFQPRARDGLGTVRHWTIHKPEIDEWRDRYDIGIKDCVDTDTGLIAPRYQAGTHCHWCKAKVICKEYTDAIARDSDHLLTVISDDEKEVIPQHSVHELTMEQLEKFVLVWPKLAAFAKEAKEYIRAAGMRGEELLYHKIVEGKSDRKWSAEPERIAKVLREHGCVEPYAPRKLIGIPAAEKAVGKKVIQTLWEKPPGKPSLVDLDNKKPALEFSLGDELLDAIDNESEDDGNDVIDADF